VGSLVAAPIPDPGEGGGGGGRKKNLIPLLQETPEKKKRKRFVIMSRKKGGSWSNIPKLEKEESKKNQKRILKERETLSWGGEKRKKPLALKVLFKGKKIRRWRREKRIRRCGGRKSKKKNSSTQIYTVKSQNLNRRGGKKRRTAPGGLKEGSHPVHQGDGVNSGRKNKEKAACEKRKREGRTSFGEDLEAGEERPLEDKERKRNFAGKRRTRSNPRKKRRSPP